MIYIDIDIKKYWQVTVFFSQIINTLDDFNLQRMATILTLAIYEFTILNFDSWPHPSKAFKLVQKYF